MMKGGVYLIPFGTRYAFYFYGMWKFGFECVLGLYHELRWPADEQLNAYPHKQVLYSTTTPRGSKVRLA